MSIIPTEVLKFILKKKQKKTTDVELANGKVGEGVNDWLSWVSSPILDEMSLFGLLISCHLYDSKIQFKNKPWKFCRHLFVHI